LQLGGAGLGKPVERGKRFVEIAVLALAASNDRRLERGRNDRPRIDSAGRAVQLLAERTEALPHGGGRQSGKLTDGSQSEDSEGQH
jgi:hypothetical protein